MTEVPIRLPQPILILSDGTGDTAEKVVRAGLRQFSDHVVWIRTYPHVDSPDKLRRIFRVALRQNALVVTTLVRRDMGDLARRLAKETGVPQVDLLGSLLLGLESFLDERASGVPGLLHQADDRYFKRIEAVEFTVKADDGKEPRMLKQADIILVGVSRTSKTPLSTFLAHKGFKVANVPLVLDRPVPPPLFEVDSARVFALTINPSTLIAIRRSRLQAMRMPETTNYCDMDYILAELEYANDLFLGNREWPVIDVTNKAIEETASTILGYLRERGLVDPIGDISQLQS
jgi:regulator of PEP synthase PpsR (kinase-PPPase family)